MTVVWDLDLPHIDPLDPEFVATFHQRNAEALACSWVVMSPFGPAVLGHAQVTSLLRDPRLATVSLQSTLELQGISDGRFFDRVTRGLLGTDGRGHARLRRALAPALSPRAVDRMRPGMRRIIDGILDEAGRDGRCDATSDVAARYAPAVVCEVLGLPPEDGSLLAGWARDEMAIFDFDLIHDRPRVEAAHAGFDRYLAALLEDRRTDPGDDLVSALLDTVVDGTGLLDPEVAMLVENLIVGGIDTAANQLGLVLWALAREPDQWEAVGADARLAVAAVEESLRWHATVGAVFRRCVDAVELDGVSFPAGTVISLVMEAANRDPSVHPCPHAYDLSRADPAPPLAFGMGAHRCVGASLARAELEEAVAAITARWTEVRLAGPAVMRTTSGFAGLERLPLGFRHR